MKLSFKIRLKRHSNGTIPYTSCRDRFTARFMPRRKGHRYLLYLSRSLHIFSDSSLVRSPVFT